jgi:GR25 family glycosyltransferase involved in LPS biosynthesis
MDYRSLNKLVINLPSRRDRLENVQSQLNGIEYTIIDGVIDSKPLLGIAQAHLNCIKHAKANNWSEVLIMEDDVVLRPNFEDHLNHCLYNLPTDWEVLLGGVYNKKSLIKHNDFWDKIGEFRGLHFYIVNQSAYDKILSYDPSEMQHIDAWINRHGKRLNCYVTKKFVATQKAGYSDNVKATVDYSHLIGKNQLL